MMKRWWVTLPRMFAPWRRQQGGDDFPPPLWRTVVVSVSETKKKRLNPEIF